VGLVRSQVGWANVCIVCPRKPNTKDKLFDNLRGHDETVPPYLACKQEPWSPSKRRLQGPL